MTAAEFHEPQTRHVKKGDRQNPHGVDERQSMTIPGGLRGEVSDHGTVQDRLVKG